MTPTLILASNSPRRRQLLSLTGWTFTVRPAEIDETPLPGEPPSDYVCRLAEGKARAAAQMAHSGVVVLAADTTVADGSLILGKPADAGEARQMLRSLGGREHSVFTAVGVTRAGSSNVQVDLCQTRVWMRNYTEREIKEYIASGDPFDKAGAYAIQHPGFQPVERIEGCYACVVGLPLCRAVRALANFGLYPTSDVTATCPSFLETNTPCPVYEMVSGSSPAGGAI